MLHIKKKRSGLVDIHAIQSGTGLKKAPSKFGWPQRTFFAAGVLAFAGLGAYLLFTSNAAIVPPNNATVSMCGARQPQDGEIYTGPTLPNPAFTKAISPGVGIASYGYWPGKSGVNPRWYFSRDVNRNTLAFSVYDATTNALVTNFNVVPPSNELGEIIRTEFAIEPSSGDVIVGSYNTPSGGGVVSRWTTSGTKVWSKASPQLITGAVYGYTDGAGQFRVGTVVNDAGTTKSFTYNASGVQQANNLVVGTTITVATAYNNDIVSTDNGNVYVYDSTGTTQKFFMGSSGSIPNAWSYSATAATEDASGNIITNSFATRSFATFDPTGVLLGMVGADTGAGDPLDFLNNSSMVTIVGGKLYYVAENPFSGPNVLAAVNYSDMQLWMNATKNVPYHLGMGAGVSTPASNNYFKPGVTPQVNIQFASWWGGIASNYTATYTVRSIQQIKANQAGTPVSFTIPGSGTAYSSGTATIPVILPSTQPGYYEVNVLLKKNGNPVGAECLGYTIGAAGSTLDFATLPGGADARGVALAYQLGQRLYRSNYNIDDCFPGVSSPTSSTPLACSTDMDNDIAAATTLANQLGVLYEIQLGTGNGFESNAVRNGQWQRVVQLVAAHYPNVNTWECWNEPDNNTFSGAADYVNNGLKPCYTAVKAVSSSDKVVGISNEGHSAGQYQAYVQAGALSYLDIVGFHPYTGHNRSFEEEGQIIPSMYAQSGQKGHVDDLKSYLISAGYIGPLYDTESGFWNEGTSSYYTQGDKMVRKYVLLNSIGVTKDANFYNDGQYKVGSVRWGLIRDTFSPGAAAMAVFQNQLNGRAFQSWIATGIPHTYAALYGPGGGDTNSKAVVWSDDYSVDAKVALGSAALAITDQYGATSTAPSGSSLTLTGSVQYISVPSSKTLTIAPPTTFGTNYALSINGGVATASSNAIVASNGAQYGYPQWANDGIDNTQGKGGNFDGISAWMQSYTDNNPWLQVTFNGPKLVDRIYVASQGLGSVQTGLRSYDVQVDNGSGTFVTVAQVRDLFFARNNLINITPQTVKRIKLVNMSVNYSGYGDGLPPPFWPSNWKTTDDVWSGQTVVYELEAYGSDPSQNSLESERGIVGGNAHVINDDSASSKGAVKFGP